MTESEQSVVENVKPGRQTSEELEKLDKPSLIDQINTLYNYLESQKPEDVQALRDSEEKCRQQVADVTRRESMLLKSLTEKEREISDLAAQIEELKQYQLPSTNQLRTMLLEPTVNVVINRLKKELSTTKLRLEESQSELNAWKFTQDSQTGKQLMARCRTLLKENEELGKQISQGRIAKLEGEIALEKKLVEEMKVAQNETEQFVMDLDDDTEGLQATIYLLQDQLKEAKERINFFEGCTTDPNQSDAKENTDLPPNSETIIHQTTEPSLSTPISNVEESLTLKEQPETRVIPSEETTDSIPNGTVDTPERDIKGDPVISEQVTTGDTDNGLTSSVGNNGFTEMMVTN